MLIIPTVSVIIPVHNGGEHLPRCLGALFSSAGPTFECLVVDDGSTDISAKIARDHGAKVMSTGSRRGPAYARNLGASAATADILVFLDSDIQVCEETISRIAKLFAEDLSLDAVMGSYDDQPFASNFISQYRNLMHAYVHQSAKREATTFWAGCGGIRRQVFLDSGGFNESYQSATIEDIELGYRLAKEGRKIALIADLRVKHLKRWNLWGVVRTDFLCRALPWSMLILRSGVIPDDLNVKVSQRISVALTLFLTGLGSYLLLGTGTKFLIPLLVTLLLLLSSYWLECFGRSHRLITGIMLALLATICGLAYVDHVAFIIPVVISCWLALFIRHRYSRPLTAWHRWTGNLVGGGCLLAIAYVWFYSTEHFLSSIFVLLLVSLVAINCEFYLFLAGTRGRLFALAAIPFHLLYFVLSGLACVCAVFNHSIQTGSGILGISPTSPPAPRLDNLANIASGESLNPRAVGFEKSAQVALVLLCAIGLVAYLQFSDAILPAVFAILRTIHP